MNKKYLFIALLALTSCKKFLTPDPEKNAIQSTTVFTSDGSATSAILGIYTSMMYGSLGSTCFNGSLGVYLGFASDELNDFTQRYPDWVKDQVNYTGYAPNYYLWSTAYYTIYQSNAAIEGLTASTSLSDSIKTQLLGEAYFIRAFSYFTLTNMYGAVPLTVTSDYSANASLARTDSAAVYQQVVSDLQKASVLLTASYPSSNMVRANRYVAQALLARVYLYQQHYAQAEAEADSVLSGPYQLVSSLQGVFQKNSNEVIWQLLPVSEASQNAYDFGWYTPANATSGPIYYLTPSLAGSFEAGDKRKTSWVTAYPYMGTTYYYASKYVTAPSAAAAQYNVVLRLAEQYLIRAEARAWQNNLSGAASDLNAVRSRAGLAATTATTQAGLLTAIAHERQVELFTEWGHRWFDLKRTGTINTVLGTLKPTWTSDAQLLPIPLKEISADPNLTQNPGYN
ncbi:RagB/SusD family nutrient uptake outer membrane protein [Dinghuibacter silviterrae]|uniref:Putative outer membrane starch-binding protein n=1 Tax=Dinghuibacter silviterrae TaxID=1539049 RepID=A0A4R8DVC5_9BACT|nr:RagB/SusD family nutrient uptake outer membrane protein [Dinghuibacter silviterrae]TDX01425.1 putative outer membrane starch-binding protein [Dinghuibacter silviterrae]